MIVRLNPNLAYLPVTSATAASSKPRSVVVTSGVAPAEASTALESSESMRSSLAPRASHGAPPSHSASAAVVCAVYGHVSSVRSNFFGAS